MKKSRTPEEHICDFCGKSQDEVERMIAGKEADICNRCVQTCLAILLQETKIMNKPVVDYKYKEE